MGTSRASTPSKQKKQASRWLPGGIPDELPSSEDVDRFDATIGKLAAEIHGLPPDLAINHDFYLHGLPKKQP